MKIIPFVVFLSLLSIQASCSDAPEKNVNDASQKTITLSGKQQRDTVFLTFSIPEKTIRAKRTGKLERLVERPEFKKNSLLVQFDDYDAFVELSGEKEALKEDLTNVINTFSPSLKPIEKKWRDFANKLTPDKITPAFPTLEYKEEAGVIEEAKIGEKYLAIQKKEAAVQNYFQLSPEDGFMITANAHTDEYVKKGETLISYHPKKVKVRAEAIFPLTQSILKQIKSNLSIRIPVDAIKIIRTSAGRVTYSLTLNQRLDPKICPKYLIINQDQNAFRVPKEFVRKNKKAAVVGEKDLQPVYYQNGNYVIYSEKSSLTIQK